MSETLLRRPCIGFTCCCLYVRFCRLFRLKSSFISLSYQSQALHAAVKSARSNVKTAICCLSHWLRSFSRVAIVMISGAQSAEAAVSELHGSSMQGHRLHVEHINRAVGGSQSRAAASVRGPETPQDAVKPQTSKTDSSSAEGKVRICVSVVAAE